MAKDKRIPARQVVEIVHDYYDDLERCSLAALRKALHEVYGFGQIRQDRLMGVYLAHMGEEAVKRMEEMKSKIRRRIG